MLSILSFFSWICLADPAGPVFHLDLEPGQHASIFNFDSPSCQTAVQGQGFSREACPATAWPDNDTKLTIAPDSKPLKLKVQGPDTSEDEPLQEITFAKVNYVYDRLAGGKLYHKEGTGWIDQSLLRDKELRPFFGAVVGPKIICPDKKKKPFEDIPSLGASIENLGVEKSADELYKVVGFCAVKGEPNADMYKVMKAAVGKLPPHGNVYDIMILPKLLKEKLPPLRNEDNKPITQQQLISIDAMARTLYGEMAQCYKEGLHYPFAVARVIENRANETNQAKQDIFIQGPHNDLKPDDAKACTTANQFSVWLKKILRKPKAADSRFPASQLKKPEFNGALTKSLCPARSTDAPYWNTKPKPKRFPPPEYDIDAWKNSVRIATEAVLFPKKFRQRTTSITQEYYSSGMIDPFKMHQVFPSIEGRQILDNQCLQIWE